SSQPPPGLALRGESRSLPSEPRLAPAPFHVALQASDASRDLEREPLAIAGDVRGARPQIPGAVGGGEDDRDGSLHRDVAVVETERVGDHPRTQIVLAREWLTTEIRVRVLVRVPPRGHGDRRRRLAAA